MAKLRYVEPRRPRERLYRGYAALSATGPALRISRAVGWRLDPILLRLTGYRLGTGLVLPTLLLGATGARTRRHRRNAVIYFHDPVSRDGSVVVVASKAGLPEHPAWFHNLRADPEVTVNGEPYRAAVVADDAERERLWGLADCVFPPFAGYRERASESGRTVPIVRLAPRR